MQKLCPTTKMCSSGGSIEVSSKNIFNNKTMLNSLREVNIYVLPSYSIDSTRVT